jgi:glycine/D-amino acid oxidase-like deaminating enzyme
MRAEAHILPADDDRCGWIAMLPCTGPPRSVASDEWADCAVIGAGFTGLAAARRLAQHRPDWRVVVLEAQRVGWGASGRNSGFVVDAGHYDPALGVEGNRRLVRLGRAGRDQLRELVHAHGIDCAWTERGRLHAAVGDVGMRALDELLAGLDAMREPYESLSVTAMARITGTTHYRAGARTSDVALVQPAALVRGLAKTLPPSVELFETSPVRRIRRGGTFELQVGAGRIMADRLFVTTNGYTPALGLLARRVFPLLTFASLSRVLTDDERAALGGEPEWGVVPEERMGTTVRRTRDQRVFIRNTVRYAPRLVADDACLREVREIHHRAFRERFPMLPAVDLEYTWGGVLGMSLNGAQFFGEVDTNCFAAAGYNGVGLAMGTVSGTLLADLAVGADSELMRDLRALPGPSWIPPKPLLGMGVRATVAFLARRARAEL